jgi:hypothetical protein
MGRGIRLQLSWSVGHRERIEALLRGGVQEVQTAGRALALRQLDWGFSDSQSWVSGGLGGQDNPGDRTAISGGGAGARAVRCATSGLGAVARSGAASAGGRAGLPVASGAFCTLDSKTYCGKDGSSQDRFGDRSGSYPGASPKPRPEAVAGKVRCVKAWAMQSSALSTSGVRQPVNPRLDCGNGLVRPRRGRL